ncbi:hypothetical protein MKW94_012653 [Papaver nudicaule]|uniref:Peptidase S26 domain-containing protein n=1 Tax=Papaver nudicaule TaxID=74823 RepID=A0AA41V3B4_PAPNU|nr:hypothetical protein [Papaver nudicaule]MCL7032960.1 hypothetical protein [Papaver nudicaule]
MSRWRNLFKGENVKEAFDRTFLFAKFLCFLHVTNTYLCSPVLVRGPSMLPTLSLTGDLLLGEKISTRLGKVKNGDIVLVRSPENPKRILTKRILGMEGDNVTYLVDPQHSEKCRTVTVPKGHVWIQGDNIYASRDSRDFGPIPYGLIQSKAFCRIWPISGFGSMGPDV